MCESLSKVDSVTRSAFSMFNESVGHESSGEVHTIYSEDPRVSIPDSSMPLNISPAISEWLEELLCSSKNIEVLANSSLGVIGKGDEDLRMREMASEGTSLEDYRKSTRLVMLRKNLLNVSCIFLPLALHFPIFSNNFFFVSFFLGSSFFFIIKTISHDFLYPLHPLHPGLDLN